MPRPALRGVPSLILILTITLFLESIVFAQEPPKVDSPAWKADKCERILEVVTDLRGRKRPDLDEATAKERKRLLDALEQYARSGAFPINDLYPHRLVPYFIDARGRRCALAHLIETSGEQALLERLALEANNAYISQIGADDEILTWLGRHGFSVDEVAYIQGPSIIDRPAIGPGTPGSYFPPGFGRPGGPDYEGPGGIGRVPGTTPRVRPGTRPPIQGPGYPGLPTAGGRTPIPGGGAAVRRKASSSTLDFGSWWRLERDSQLSIRARYHARGGISPQGDDQRLSGSALRPGDDELAAIEKVFAGLRRDPALETTILMALTEAPRTAEDREALAHEILVMLGDRKARHREFAILALGRTKAQAALAPLIAVLGNKPAGRKVAAASSRIPDDLRSMAAFALAQLETPESAAALLAALDLDGASVDLRCSIVLGLAQLGQARVARESILPALVSLAGDKKAPAPVRNQAMAALGIVGDRSVLPVILEPLRRFRGSVEFRRAAARSIAALGGGLEREVFDVLSASGRRDTDAGTRQLAVAAIGELSSRDQDRGPLESKARRELIDEVGRFLDDGVTQFFKQRVDRPFYALAAGLHAGSHAGHRAGIAKSLGDVLREGKRVEDRAAAALALGLSGSEKGRELLRETIGSSRTPMVAGYAAEALGLLEDQNSAETLLAMAVQANDEFVAYQATIALAALGQVEAQPKLIEALRETRSESLRAALARALGQMGDRRSVGALLEIASDKGRNLRLRLRAISALGLVLREADRSWAQPIRQALDPSSYQPTPGLISGVL